MTVRILLGDCREVLKTLPDESVHCVVTSPPYWGLRDYGTAKWEGGYAACDHLKPLPGGYKSSGLARPDNGLNEESIKEKQLQRRQEHRALCEKCGARRVDSQMGLEPTPSQFIAEMVAVFREVRRVLRHDGTCWVNMGDNYVASAPGNARPDHSGPRLLGTRGGQEGSKAAKIKADRDFEGLKTKDMVGMPWRLAFALQADGWWLRSDIIWEKPNPMPESTRDRPTKSHEYIFLLTKSERYFYDAEAVKEPMSDVSLQRLSQPNVLNQPGGPKDPKDGNRSHKKAINNQAERLIRHEKWKTRFDGWDKFDKSLGRNKRTVWKIATYPFPEAHFATFPPELPETCIKAGSSERGCCAKCGAPWVRQVSRDFVPQLDVSEERGVRGADGQKPLDESDGRDGFPRGTTATSTSGWVASCDCAAAVSPCMVMDPFGGAGTTGLVADRLGRHAILIELNPQYADIAERRIRRDAPLFAEVSL